MPDLVDALQRYADAAGEAVPETDLAGITARPRRWRTLAVSAAAVAALTVGSIVVLRADKPSATVAVDSTDLPPTSSTTTSASTTTTGPATRSLRHGAVVVVTDRDYVVWGGEAGENDTSQRADGFAVDLATGAVRPIPVAPIDPRSAATGAWTGTELIVCCGFGTADGGPGDTRSAAAWNPMTNEWRALADPPAALARSFASAVWTGDRMVVVAQGAAAAAYDPLTDRWSEMAAPLLAGRQPQAWWTGEQVVVWDPSYTDSTAAPDRGWVWAPGDDDWTRLPDLPEGFRTQLGGSVWNGTQLVVWGAAAPDDAVGVGARWRPGDDGWRPMAPSPQGQVDDPFNGTPGSQSLAADTDGRVLIKALDGGTTGGTYVYDPSRDTWSPAPLSVDGFAPQVALVNGTVFVPDEAQPVAGRIR